MKEPVTVTVYPTKASALLLSHPSHGLIDPNGSIWPKDIFTIKRLADGSVSETNPSPSKSSGAKTSATSVTE